MYLSLLALPLALSGEFIHTEQGTMGKLPSDAATPILTFDEDDPIASHPDMMKIANEIYERNIRRGLSDPNVLTDTDRQLMLDLHNQIRSEVARGIYMGPGGANQPGACDMNALMWSSALEQMATKWSDNCLFDHDTRACDTVIDTSAVEWGGSVGSHCGENLYVSGASPQMNMVWNGKNYGILGGIGDSWSAEESEKWSYQAYHPNTINGAGHYTQVVWANTRYVGCGFKTCNGISSTQSGFLDWGQTMFTCNYWPAGNYVGQKPYTEGTACGCCDADRKVCSHDGGLCGGGWNSNFAVDGSNVVDSCYDGTGRNVCDDTSSTNAGATTSPTMEPTPSPVPPPVAIPAEPPIITPVSGGNCAEEDCYTVQVTTKIYWLTTGDDYSEVDQNIEDLIYEKLAAPYLDVTAQLVSDQKDTSLTPVYDNDGTTVKYRYGYYKAPMLLQQVDEDTLEEIQDSVDERTYQVDLCNGLTNLYRAAGQSLYCYKSRSPYTTATVDSITSSEYGAFTGEDTGDVEFNILNLESYSGGGIFALLVFMSFICCACWCVGWYAHKRKFANDLEREMQSAKHYQASDREGEIKQQLMANAQPSLFEKGLSKMTNR